jgi:hypothetical protein
MIKACWAFLTSHAESTLSLSVFTFSLGWSKFLEALWPLCHWGRDADSSVRCPSHSLPQSVEATHAHGLWVMAFVTFKPEQLIFHSGQWLSRSVFCPPLVLTRPFGSSRSSCASVSAARLRGFPVSFRSPDKGIRKAILWLSHLYEYLFGFLTAHNFGSHLLSLKLHLHMIEAETLVPSLLCHLDSEVGLRPCRPYIWLHPGKSICKGTLERLWKVASMTTSAVTYALTQQWWL